MSQYRIKQIGNRFYPQKKWAGLFWGNIIVKYNNFDFEDFIEHCDSLDEARRFLDEVSVPVIIHKYP